MRTPWLSLAVIAALASACQGEKTGADPDPVVEDPVPADFELRIKGTDQFGVNAFLVGVSSIQLKIDGEVVPVQQDATWVDLAKPDHAELLAKLPHRPGDHKYAFDVRFDDYGALEKGGTNREFRGSTLPLTWEAPSSYLETHGHAVIELELNKSIVTTTTGEAWLMPRATLSY